VLHVPVVQLNVPQAWRVGRVTFRPAGWLAGYTRGEAAPTGTAKAKFLAYAREQMDAHQTSTAEVRVRWPEKDKQSILDAAMEHVRDSVAVLLLYQRTRYPRVNTDLQQFGIHGDVGAVAQSYTVTRGRRIIATGHRLLGIPGDWTFSRADAVAFRNDPRFVYLDRALRAAPGRRREFQRRALTAVRTRSLATAMLREQLRVVLLATALEALLAAEVQPNERRELGEFFRIAQRASYLFCGEPDQRYPSRPPCLYLHANSKRAMVNALEDRARRGQQPICTYFWDVFDLLEDRNQALHRAREGFGRRQVSRHATTTEQVILYALEWVDRTGAVALADLEAEFEAFVRGGKATSN